MAQPAAATVPLIKTAWLADRECRHPLWCPSSSLSPSDRFFCASSRPAKPELDGGHEWPVRQGIGITVRGKSGMLRPANGYERPQMRIRTTQHCPFVVPGAASVLRVCCEWSLSKWLKGQHNVEVRSAHNGYNNKGSVSAISRLLAK